MIAKNKKNRFAKFMSIFLVGIFAVFLAFMPFMMNKNKDKVLADSVSSDNLISFYSSSTIVPVNLVGINDISSHVNLPEHMPVFLDLAFVLRNFNISGDGVSPSLFFSAFTGDSQNFSSSRVSRYIYADINNQPTSWYAYSVASSSYYYLVYNTYTLGGIVPSGSLASNYRIIFEYYLESSFNFNISRCVIDSVDGFLASGYYGNRITLYDTNNRVFKLHFPLSTLNHAKWGLMYDYSKDYYLISSDDLSDNQFYNQGYSDGYSNGESAGYNAGNQSGYSAGYSAGESAGYNAGVVAGGNVSWTNMFGAMVDVPVSSLVSMLDFNLNLGGQNFNLYHFLLAVLTLAITIAIVRLILAKGGK